MKRFTSVHFIDFFFDVAGRWADLSDILLQQIENVILLKKRELQGPLALREWPPKDWHRFFDQDSLIAVDLTTWPAVAKLTVLRRVLARFPIIAVNLQSPLIEERILDLQYFLEKQHWILPIFPYYPQNGIWQIGSLYSLTTEQLLAGEKFQVKVADLRGPSAEGDENEFIQRAQRDFPFFKFSDTGDVFCPATSKEALKYSVRWLGAPNIETEEALGRIYDSNQDQIHLDDLGKYCDPRIIENLKKYFGISMLFPLDESNSVLRPRLLRKDVHISILTHSAWEFQRRLVEHCATSASPHRTVLGKRVQDFHDIQALFSADKQYGRKLAYLAKAEIEAASIGEFDRVLIFAYGIQENFIDQLGATLQKPISRCVHMDEHMRLYPYDEIKPNEKVLIVCDVINQGDLISNMIHLVENDCNASVACVFTYIANTDLNENKLRHRRGPETGSQILLRAWIRKPLRSVSVSLPSPRAYQENVDVETAHDFLFFWEMVDMAGMVEVSVHRSRPVKLGPLDNRVECEREFSHIIVLDRPERRNGYYLRDFCARFSGAFQQKDYSTILSNKGRGANSLARHLKDNFSINASITSVSFSNATDADIPTDLGDRILIVDDGINTFHNLRHMLEILVARGLGKDNVDAVVLFRRENVTRTLQNALTIEKAGCCVHCNLYVYYNSCLPVYIIASPIGNKVLHSPFEGQHQDWERMKIRWKNDEVIHDVIRDYMSLMPAERLIEEVLGEIPSI